MRNADKFQGVKEKKKWDRTRT